ncbi:CHAT domain protein [Neorhodopirellula pilleata]|uniref:CHAT domain protein n=1 Tax=Neorhodopirellula pilleata TaxID=2714738 RepID=A0A5C6AIA7_9BACT|nr:CHAT domain protein [Neorhodopirellula pilleata]
MQQAFRMADAESVVSTLWQIHDRESAWLMGKFFQNLATGLSRSASLRAAQLEQIQQRKARFGAAYPYYWAAFTVTGNDQ